MRKYGYTRTDKGRTVRAHRVSWEFVNGPIPKDMCILHKCDNPPCVNPSHLWLGTQLENIKDRQLKGRQKTLRGESHPNNRFSAKEIQEMRKLYSAGKLTSYDLAKLFKTSQGTIWGIISRKSWAHIP